MAINQIKEPYVKVREVIREYPTQLSVDGTTNIGGVIIAPTGPRLAFITSPQQFLNTYTPTGEIPRNAHISLINAYYLSFSTGLVLVRSMNTTAVAGLAFHKKEAKASVKISYSFKGGSEPEEFIFTVGDKNYFKSSKSLADLQAEVAAGTGAKNWNGGLLKAVKDDENLVTVTSFEDFLSKLREVGGASGKMVVAHVDNTITISNYATGYTTDNFKSVGTRVQFSVAQPQELPEIVTYPVKFKDGSLLSKQRNIIIKGNLEEDSFAVVLGDVAYLKGPIPRSYFDDYSVILIDELSELEAHINMIPGFTSEYKKTDSGCEIVVSYSEGNALGLVTELSGKFTGVQGGEIQFDHAAVSLSAKEDPVDGTNSDSTLLFYVHSTTPHSTDKYSITLTPADSDGIFLVRFGEIGKEINSYQASFDPEKRNEGGSNVHIGNLNSLNLGINIILPDVDTDSEEENALFSNGKYFTPEFEVTKLFGDSGVHKTRSAENTSTIGALRELEEQGLYEIEYLAPLGHTNTEFIRHYLNVGKRNDWFTPVDIPRERTNANSIMQYFRDMPSESNMIAMGPFDKNVGLTGWLNYIACSTLYYTRILQNKASLSEFAPTFDLTNGVLDFTNPAYMLGESDRTKLLNAKCPINFLLFNQRSNVYYLNDNRTHQFGNNIVGEEQNRRMVNKIKKDCNRMLHRFKGRNNTVSTREDVRTLLDLYFKQIIQSQRYKVEEYQLICDESNNPIELITANKLAVTVRVRLRNAIKFIDVLVDVYPLGVEFEQ